MKKITYVLLAFWTTLPAMAQDRVLVANAPDGNEVYIKYYTETVYYDEAIHYYRRQAGQGEWELLNLEPVRPGAYEIPAPLLREDKKLAMVVKLIDSVGHTNMQGILRLLVMLKSFERNELGLYMGNMFIDSTAKKGVSYQYRVTRQGEQGEREIGVSEAIGAGLYRPVAPPGELKIELLEKERQAAISWLPESTRYYGTKVYRRAGPDGEWTDLTPQPVLVSKQTGEDNRKAYADVLFTDDSLQTGVTYYYRLRALDFFGGGSAFSETLEVKIEDTTPPPAPVALHDSANHALQTVWLRWDHPGTTPDLRGFYVYRARSSKGPFVKAGNTILNKEARLYKDHVPAPGGYYYYVTAVDIAGNEARSAMKFLKVNDMVPPAAPKMLKVHADSTAVTISWTPGTEADLSGYRVYRTIDPAQVRWVLLNARVVREPRITDRLPGNSGNTFYYRVVSLDTAFNKSVPSAPVAATLTDVTPPAKMFIKRVAETAAGLRVIWMPVLDDDVKEIQVYRSAGEAADTLLAIVSPGRTLFEDSSVVVGTGYYYSLVARDSAGNSAAPSNRFAGTWHTAGKVLVIEPVKVAYDSAQQAVGIQWTGNAAGKGYIVYRKEEEAEYKPVTGLIQQNTYVDKNIRQGRRYQYMIRGYGKHGPEGASENYVININ